MGMLAWVMRLFVRPRPRIVVTSVGVWLAAFFVWSLISSLASYEPLVSLNKLRGVAVLLIFFYAVGNIRNWRALGFLAFALIASSMVNVVWTPINRLIGRGVEIHGVDPAGPLGRALLYDGDTLLAANGRKVRSPEDIARELSANDTTRLTFYRPDFDFTVEVRRDAMLEGASAEQRLGIASWSRSHNWRSSGFYGHYATYSEVLQLLGALALGLAVAFFLAGRMRAASLLAIALGLISLALLLSGTRASEAGLAAAAAVIIIAAGNRRMIVAAAVLAVPVAIAAVVYLQASRNVGYIDAADTSTQYREVMWRDGLRIWTESPRHFIFGVGMDSVQRHWQEWGMFEDGRLPLGHFHSTPVQLAVERGLPALLLWLIILGVYARSMWRGMKDVRTASPVRFGVILGALGSIAGFFTSGLVHYNLGDQEVAMVFCLLMAFGYAATVNSEQ
jgi:O-antigen ligase